MKLRPQALFSAFILALAVGALLYTRGWPIKTALYPRAVAIPLIALAAFEFVLSLRDGSAEPGSGGQAMDFALSAGLDSKNVAARTAMIFAWIGGFFGAVILLGFPLAIPIFVFVYLKVEAREGWLLSLILAAAAWLLFNGLFVRLLHLPFAEGLLWRTLGR